MGYVAGMPYTEPNGRLFERRDRRPHPQAILGRLRELGMSRSALAERAGYDRTTLWKALNGELITYGFGTAIAEVLDVDPAEVMDLEPVDPEEVA